MTLRRKTILVMTLLLLGLVLLLYFVLSTIMLDSFNSLERQVTLRNLNRTTNSLNNEVNQMGRSIQDWSAGT